MKIKLDVFGERVIQLQAPEGSVQFKNYVAMQSTVPRSLHASSSITYEFSFSRILDQSVNQRELYLSSVDPLVSRFHNDATNSLVFCYGVTNSGKTYTLFGVLSYFHLKSSLILVCRLIYNYRRKDAAGTCAASSVRHICQHQGKQRSLRADCPQ